MSPVRTRSPAQNITKSFNALALKETLGRCSSGVERFLGKEEVTGSNPVIGSNKRINYSTALLKKEGMCFFKIIH
jgi:hypothetical protein